VAPDCRVGFAGILVAALGPLIACSNPAAPDVSVRVDPIPIDTVAVLTEPPRATAHVRGQIGDGCSTLKSVTQARSGDVVTLTILRERPVEAVCTLEMRLYDEKIPLEGSYTSGPYTLRVNGVELAFRAD
jgi:hypothetical protein